MKKELTPEQHKKRLEAQKRYREKNKSILNAKSLQWQKENKDKAKKAHERYVEKNKDLLLKKWKEDWQKKKANLTEKQKQDAQKRRQKWKSENPEKAKECARNWARKNPDKKSITSPEKRNAITAKRRSVKLKAIPIWFDDLDDLTIKEAHSLAKLREKITGIKWHVDHIIPLQGKKVCGLHCWNNVQVIPAKTNLSKSNFYEGT